MKPKSLAEQERDWLDSSCLSAKDIAGRLVKAARTIEFFSLDGSRLPEADIVRQFVAPGSFASQTVDGEAGPKYLHPSGVRPHLYYPQNSVSQKFVWAAHVKDVAQRKIYAEGAKKAATGMKFGFPTAGIEGCWGWKSVNHGLLMLPEFNDYTLTGAEVYWVPDRERKPKSVADILRASNAFGLLMKERGAKFHLVWLPLLEGYSKVGLDDFLFHYSRAGKDKKAAAAAFEDVLAATPLWEDYEITDPGNSRRWVSMYGSRFRSVGKRGWYTYRAGVWAVDAHLEHQETSKEMFEGMMEDARHGGNSERFAILRQHVTAARIENVTRLAKSDSRVVTTPDQFDRHPLLVNCTNGTLELPSEPGAKARLLEHRLEDLLTKQVSVRYVPEAECPVFLEVLNFWTDGDKDLRRTVQQLLGISLSGLTREQVFIILWGPSQSGKSTLIEIVRLILASYAKTISAETFMLRKFGAPEERKVANLPGVRFGSASETESGGRLDENLIKLLTGEDSVTGRRLYEEQFDFNPEAKLWLRTNNRPEIRSTDESTWRRLISLPFGQVVTKKDVHLKDKLKAELEGIFAWMVRGFEDYIENGFFKAPVVLADIAQYRAEQDIFERFFADRCNFDPEKKKSTRKDVLYAHFQQWAFGKKVGVMPSGDQFYKTLCSRFSERIADKRVTLPKEPGEKKQRQENRWVGVELKPEWRKSDGEV
jgi:P4 family phage/plasmid primase-like protien